MIQRTLFPFLFCLALSAGCFEPTATDQRDEHPAERRSFTTLNITRALAMDWQANHFVVKIPEPAVLDLTFGNGRPRETPDSWEGCGWIEFRAEADGNETSGHQMGWGESSGHALVYASEGSQANAVNHSSANDDLAGGVDVRWERTIEVGADATLDIWLFAQSLGGVAFEPFFNVTSRGAPFDLVQAEPVPFVCGAGLSGFSGDFSASGLPGLWLTRVEHATAEFSLKHGSEGSLLFSLNPRYGGTCNVSVALDGRELDRSAEKDQSCVVSWDTGPGALELRIDDSVAYGAAVLYGFVDR